MLFERKSSLSRAEQQTLLPSCSPPAKRGHQRDSAAVLTYILAAVLGALLLIHACQGRGTSVSSAMPPLEVSGPIGAASMPPKIQELDTELLSKMRQVEVLKSQLEKAAMAGEIKSANIHAQEAIIRVLQQQHDAEKGAKLKAQHALQDKEQAYQKCSGQSQQLRKDITHCNNELSAYGRAALAGDAL